ncbi:hypothetical protein WG66_008116 [Moniliophthora roreri]|nr:hypothetical protein WG66_008116 [Moniliophthora roreri]
MSINHSSRVSIKGKNTFNHIHGHQFNAPIHGNVVFSAGQEVVKRTEYDEFQYVRRGNMIIVKEIHFAEWDWKWRPGKVFARHKIRRTIYTVELVDRQSKFTAMVYEGEDAHSFWEDDFQQFSQIKIDLDGRLLQTSECQSRSPLSSQLLELTFGSSSVTWDAASILYG